MGLDDDNIWEWFKMLFEAETYTATAEYMWNNPEHVKAAFKLGVARPTMHAAELVVSGVIGKTVQGTSLIIRGARGAIQGTTLAAEETGYRAVVECEATPLDEFATAAAVYSVGWMLTEGGIVVGGKLLTAVEQRANAFLARLANPHKGTPFVTEGSEAFAFGSSTDGKLYHYTRAANAESIAATGLRPGAAGKVYLTSEEGLSPLQAQIDLALPPNRGLSGALFEVDVAALRRAGFTVPEPTLVPRAFNMPGGGSEVILERAIPPELLRRIR
jgi:hypothetical protein